VTPGSAGLVSLATGGSWPGWDCALVLGILAGGWLAARRAGPVVFTAPAPPALLQRFAGGVGLGVGASIATGCTVGQGLTGLALLAPSSVVVMASIFAGSALSILAARRRTPALASPHARSAPRSA
jgi:hypothetical protein